MSFRGTDLFIARAFLSSGNYSSRQRVPTSRFLANAKLLAGIGKFPGTFIILNSLNTPPANPNVCRAFGRVGLRQF
jgi:hypothetical protein